MPGSHGHSGAMELQIHGVCISMSRAKPSPLRRHTLEPANGIIYDHIYQQHKNGKRKTCVSVVSNELKCFDVHNFHY